MMLWVNLGDRSYQIIACNVAKDKQSGLWQVWIERANGMNIKVGESSSRDEVREIKDMIDYAVERGETVVRL